MTNETDAIILAERILNLLSYGKRTATYKFAVLLALLDLCLEHTSRFGLAPEMFTTRQLAEKIIEIYWPHTVPFAPDQGQSVLKQNSGPRNSQAEIISKIQRFRENSLQTNLVSLSRSRYGNPDGYRSLLFFVERKLIEMPLPRLQQVGNQQHRFIYDIAWDHRVNMSMVTAYQKEKISDFDNRINLCPGVASALVRLNGLLRPLIQRQWIAMVAQLNALPESRLEYFLFGVQRQMTAELRKPLEAMQKSRCFYCDAPLRTRSEVDHFIPWARYPNDGLANLVLAHDSCNGQKRDFLPATDHVVHWIHRLQDKTSLDTMYAIEQESHWPVRREESLGVAAGIYLNLGGEVELWQSKDEFVGAEEGRLREAFEWV